MSILALYVVLPRVGNASKAIGMACGLCMADNQFHVFCAVQSSLQDLMSTPLANISMASPPMKVRALRAAAVAGQFRRVLLEC